MKDFFGFRGGSAQPVFNKDLKNTVSIEYIEKSVQAILCNPESLNFLLEQKTLSTRRYKVFQGDISINMIVNRNTIHAEMNISSTKFFMFKYYRHIDKYNLYRYNHIFTKTDSPVYDLIHYLSSSAWEEKLTEYKNIGITNRVSDISADRSILEKDLELRTKINRIFSQDAPYLTIEDSHNLARYKNDFLLKTVDAYKRLNDAAKSTHVNEVIKQFSRIEERINEIEVKIDKRKELVLLRQLNIMNQST